MTIEAALSVAVLAALKAAPGLAALNRIGSGEGERAPAPHAWISEISGTEWGVKDRLGRELRLVLAIADRGEAARLADLSAAAEAALADVPRPLGDWDHSGLRVVRVRTVQRRDGTRVTTIEARVRILAPANSN